MKKENSGYSLVELITTLAILAIASVTIFGFMMLAVNNYSKGHNQVELSYESQIAANQITNLVMDTTRGIEYDYATDEATGELTDGTTATLIKSDSEIVLADATDSIKSKSLWLIYDENNKYQIIWKAEEKKIYLRQYTKSAPAEDGSTTWDVEYDDVYGVLAEYVEDFSFDISKAEDEHIVRMELKFKKDAEYCVIQNIALRNKVVINDNAE